MKTYEKMSYGENLSWCKPYISEDERYALAVNEGEIINIQIDGRDIEWDEKRKFSFGCAECPWRDECDAMKEE